MDYTRKFKYYNSQKLKMSIFSLILKDFPIFEVDITDKLHLKIIDKSLINILNGVDYFIIDFNTLLPQVYIHGSPHYNLTGIERADVHCYRASKTKYDKVMRLCIGTETEFLSQKTEIDMAKYILEGIIYHIKMLSVNSALVPTKPHGII